MKERFVDKFVQPRVQTTGVVCIILICAMMYFNTLIGVLGILLLGGAILYEGQANQKKKKAFSDYIENLADEMDMTVKKNIVTNPLPICIVDRDGHLEWYNRKFGEFFAEEELIYKNIHNISIHTHTHTHTQKQKFTQIFM